MKKFLVAVTVSLGFVTAFAQPVASEHKKTISVKGIDEKQAKPAGVGILPFTSPDFVLIRNNPATEVKNQGRTGTCWSFSSTSMVESQFIKNNEGASIDLSEMFTVRNIYVEKGKNYIMRQGHTQFGEGGLGHDMIRAVAKYGAVPEAAYPGMKSESNFYDHAKMESGLKTYLDSMLKMKVLPTDWLVGYNAILDKEIGSYPATFTYNHKAYTPESFAKDALKFNSNDYVNLTSFVSHPYYSPFVIDVPDNFSNGAYYNLPLKELINVSEAAIKGGYSILWDADVSNNGFRQKDGLAMFLDAGAGQQDKISINSAEQNADEKLRQQLFDNLVTQDDHLMHITGLEKSTNGKMFFVVKNSWGSVGPYKGYINVSENYFAMNTVSLVLPKAALSKLMLDKLKLNK